PGEFTLRAFLAGSIDLSQAEAVVGLIDARHTRQFDTALRQLAGGLSGPMTAARDDLLNLLADLEAGLDFADESIVSIDRHEALLRLRHQLQVLESISAHAERRLRVRTSPRIVLAGPPNAGKSTLFNTLLGRNAAIVADVAGTTRDYLSGRSEWHGVPIELID